MSSYFIEDLELGMEASHEKTVSEGDINSFADVSGDYNPVHMDEAYAAGTFFKSRIAHGMLTASLISAVLGTRLPGPGCIYVAQSLRFKAPVRPGDTVRATATVREVFPARNRVILDTVCTVGDRVVLEGEATMMPAKASPTELKP